MKKFSFKFSILSLVILVLSFGLFSLSAQADFSTLSTTFHQAINPNRKKLPTEKKHKFTCGNPISDRDGYTYNTVQIGGQCWLAENLKTRTKPDHTPLTNLSDGSERDCSNTLGNHGTEADCVAGNALYTWNATMNGSTTAGAQGLCMDGWHIPTDTEWHELENFLTSSNQTCDPTRLNSFDCANAGSDLISNPAVGFNSGLAGFRYTDALFGDTFGDFEYGGYFWTSNIINSEAMSRNVNSDENGVWRGSISVSSTDPLLSASVRCLQN